MSQAQTVTATFNLKQFTLRVRKSGDGFGTVTGNGINCGTGCTVQQVTLPYGTPVSLSQTPGSSSSTLSTFTAWSGGCTGAGACTFTLTASTTVDAAYRLSPNLMFVTSGVFQGNLGGIAGADAICRNHATNLQGTYRAYISDTVTSAGARFPGASGWVRFDNRPVMNAIGQFGGGTLFNPPLLDEAGNDLSQSGVLSAWTGTNANGTTSAPSCNVGAGDWTDIQPRTEAGNINQTSSEVVNGGIQPCATRLRIYCLGIDRAATVP
jgi:hypothetical protein